MNRRRKNKFLYVFDKYDSKIKCLECLECLLDNYNLEFELHNYIIYFTMFINLCEKKKISWRTFVGIYLYFNENIFK